MKVEKCVYTIKCLFCLSFQAVELHKKILGDNEIPCYVKETFSVDSRQRRADLVCSLDDIRLLLVRHDEKAILSAC